MSRIKTNREKRIMRHQKIRTRVSGTAARPRLAVFRSNRYVYAQVIDDAAGRTLVAASDRESKVRGKRSRAEATGALVAERAVAAGVKEVLFDRGGFNYAGRVAALADAARKGGLSF